MNDTLAKEYKALYEQMEKEITNMRDQVVGRAWLSHLLLIAYHQLVVGNFHRCVLVIPMPFPLGVSARNNRDRDFWRPQSKFSLPIGYEGLGADQQYVF